MAGHVHISTYRWHVAHVHAKDSVYGSRYFFDSLFISDRYEVRIGTELEQRCFIVHLKCTQSMVKSLKYTVCMARSASSRTGHFFETVCSFLTDNK